VSARPVYLQLEECGAALRQRITDLSKGHDPAPWAFTAEELLAGDNLTPKGKLAAISLRADKTFFRAMLTGFLKAWFTDGVDRWQIPGWAWADREEDWHPFTNRNDFLHPLLPREIRRWAGRPVLVERASFNDWLASDELEDQTGFPGLPPAYDEAERPAYVIEQAPPNTPNVSLACAISWLALGISLDADELHSALSIDAFGPDLAAIDQKMKNATERLVTAGTGGLPFWGKYVPNGGNESASMTERIDAVRLEDFRQFDVLHDGLRYGTGLLLDLTQHNMVAFNRVFPSPGHRFTDVKVERAGLMAAFPPSSQMPSPAPAPDWPAADAGSQIAAQPRGEPILIAIGKLLSPEDDFDYDGNAPVAMWWSPVEALAWIATRSQAFVDLMHQRISSGDEYDRVSALGTVLAVVSARYCSCLKELPGTEPWERCECVRNAGRDLLGRIMDGRISALDPGERRNLDAPGFIGVGDRQGADDWLFLTPRLMFYSNHLVAAFPAEMTTASPQGGNVPPNRKLNHDEIIGQAASMLAVRPGISKGSVAASIVADLPLNPRNGKPRDTRHIERMIAHLWEGGASTSPQ